jgi:hypothetical protein
MGPGESGLLVGISADEVVAFWKARKGRGLPGPAEVAPADVGPIFEEPGPEGREMERLEVLRWG